MVAPTPDHNRETVARKKSRASLKAFTSRARWWVRHELSLRQLRGMLLWAGLVGFGGALVTIGFREAIHLVEYFLTGYSGSFAKAAASLPPWRRMLTPALGALVAGLILQYGMHLTKGRRGRTNYMEAVVLGDGFMSVKGSLVKSSSSLMSIGSGGSIGREGAMVQLSAMLGSTLGRVLKFPAPQRRIMVACGAAAGIASAYNAPLAAAVFVAEIVIGGIAFDTTAPIIVSAVIANATVHGLLGYAPVFEIPPVRMETPWELVFFLFLGLMAGRLAPLYLRLLKSTSERFQRLNAPLYVKFFLGGLGVGVLSIFSPSVWGNGNSVVNSLLHNSWTVKALLLMLLLKVGATALTVGSGAVGGVFTPTLFVGATLGSLLGTCFHLLAPELTGTTTAYVVVGMGAFLSATTKAPLMGILMVFELTRQYEIVLPLMLAGITANYLALPSGISMYGAELEKGGASSKELSLPSLVQPEFSFPLQADATVEMMARRFQEIPYNHISIVDSEGRWLGVVGRKDLSTLTSPERRASELVRTDKRCLRSGMSLQEAMRAASEIRSELLPLVESETDRFLGTIAKSDLLAVMSRTWIRETS